VFLLGSCDGGKVDGDEGGGSGGNLISGSTVPHDRRYYHVMQNFELVEVAGVRRIRRKHDEKLMATETEMTRIVRDVHIATGHKRETKTHKKIQENYSNIPKTIVK